MKSMHHPQAIIRKLFLSEPESHINSIIPNIGVYAHITIESAIRINFIIFSFIRVYWEVSFSL